MMAVNPWQDPRGKERTEAAGGQHFPRASDLREIEWHGCVSSPNWYSVTLTSLSRGFVPGYHVERPAGVAIASKEVQPREGIFAKHQYTDFVLETQSKVRFVVIR